MKIMLAKCLLLLTISAALGEKPIRGRPFSRPIFLRQEEAPAQEPAQAPYQPSGWKPQGQRLVLPIRQEAGVPHTVYGPPASEAPPSEYGPPAAEEPEATDAPQYPPNNEYGPPEETPSPVEPLEPQPDAGYAPAGPPGESGSGGYEYPQPDTPFPDPSNEYGPPSSQPDNEYGAPAQQPGNEYGAPAQQPDNGYGAPPQDNGQLPVESGASERLRQKQFIQQLPGFAPSRFIKPQSLRLQQQRRPQATPQKLQQLPQRNQKQQFRQQPNRRPQNQQFQKQQVQPQYQQQQYQKQQQYIAQNQQFAQKQQLYQTPQSTVDNPNIAVSTAVSGEYYIIEPRGRLQRVSFTTLNGKLVDGKITSGIKVEELQNTNAPIYEVNEFNQLIRVNRKV